MTVNVLEIVTAGYDLNKTKLFRFYCMCYGKVSGRDSMIIANDATVKGGTYFPLH